MGLHRSFTKAPFALDSYGDMVAPYVLRLLRCEVKPARLIHDFVIHPHVCTRWKVELSRVEVCVEWRFLRPR